MYKVNGLFNSPLRRKRRELDFRVPEDRLSVENDEEQEVRSLGIDRMIKAFYAADQVNDDDGKASALRGMIDEMTALHKLRGVPVFAHPPLPPQFVAAQVDGAKSAGGTNIVSKIASLTEPNNRLAVKMQLEGSAKQRGPLADVLFPHAPESVGGNGLSGRWTHAADSRDGDLLNTDDDPRRGSSLRALEYVPSRDGKNVPWQPLPRWSAERRPFEVLRNDVPSPLRPVSSQSSDPHSEERRRRASALDDSDPTAALAHPVAYGGDAAMEDLFGKDGLFGDWGWRREIPRPEGGASESAGDIVRYYLQLGLPLGGAVRAAGAAGRGARVSRLGGAMKQVLATRSGRAVAGGVLSVVAEWRANRGKAPKDQSTGWGYGVSFLSGAITGGLEPRWGKAGLDAGVAIAGSLLSDVLSERRVSIPAALGAGVGAANVSAAGGIKNVKEVRLFAQGAGRLGKKYLEKEMKKHLSELFGDDLDMTMEEWAEFLGGVRDYLRQQWQELIERGDANP